MFALHFICANIVWSCRIFVWSCGMLTNCFYGWHLIDVQYCVYVTFDRKEVVHYCQQCQLYCQYHSLTIFILDIFLSKSNWSKQGQDFREFVCLSSLWQISCKKMQQMSNIRHYENLLLNWNLLWIPLQSWTPIKDFKTGKPSYHK